MSAEKNIKTELMHNLKTLHLPTIRDGYQELVKDAEHMQFTYERYLYELVQRECDDRRARRVNKMLLESCLPLNKTFDAFDRSRLGKTELRVIRQLEEGQFLDEKKNILLFGQSGSGKTHLICALGQVLVHKGHPVLFISFRFLVEQMLLAQRELRLNKLLKKWRRYDAIIIDDFGQINSAPAESDDKRNPDMKLGRQDREVVFALIEERYEKASIMITSNFPFSDWFEIFESKVATNASAQRLVHHSVIVELNSTSYRLEQAKANSRAQTELIGSLEEPPPSHVERNDHVNGSGVGGSAS